ncbi:MAG: metallophosphoesterase [Lachnospiraceae bacterium]
MSLYAIGDLHLNFMVDRNMDQYGSVWKHHEKRLEKNWRRYITQQDTVVVTGDHTMGRKMAECTADLDFIASLPGRKILLRGNHDMFWKSKKTPVLNEIYEGRLQFLQNNFYTYGEYALVGTKGYCFEGKDSYEHFLTIRKRELERLELSFEQAKDAGFEKFLMFLHFPPTSVGETQSPFTLMAEKYGAEKVIYSHCHGKEHFEDSFSGMVHGIEYKLVSGDYLRFKPEKIVTTEDSRWN